MVLTGENRYAGRKLSQYRLFHHTSQMPAPRLNQGLVGERPATNRLEPWPDTDFTTIIMFYEQYRLYDYLGWRVTTDLACSPDQRIYLRL